jgi:hypothetical protein
MGGNVGKASRYLPDVSASSVGEGVRQSIAAVGVSRASASTTLVDDFLDLLVTYVIKNKKEGVES